MSPAPHLADAAHIPETEATAVPESPKKSRRRRKLYTKRAKAGRRSRNKGAAHELALAQIARDHGFPRAMRSAPMQAGERQGHGERKSFPDVDGLPLLWVEGKHEKQASPKAYAREYLGERPGFIPVVCWRANGMGPDDTVAELKFTDLLKLLRMATDGHPVNWVDAHPEAVK